MEGGSWNYASKDIYLKSLLVVQAIVALAFMIPFFAPRAGISLAGITTVLALGLYSAEWLSGVLS